MTIGLGLPNCQWRAYTERELIAVRDLRPANLLLIAYPGDVTQVDRIQQEAELCRELGIASPLVRVYAEHIMRDYTPAAWAKICSDMIDLYLSVGLYVELVPANEPNLEF